MENFLEQKQNFDMRASLERIQGVSDVQKVELDAAYFEWAKENLSMETYETIQSNYAALEAYRYKYLSDGLSIAGYVWTPREIKEQLPLVVWNRGGTREFGSLGKKRGSLYSSFPCDLAKDGTIVVASEYRGGFNSEGEDTWGGDDLHDVVRIKEIADQLPMTKPGKAVVAGHSRGGMMSFLLAAKEPWVKKVISIAGATDLVASANERPEMQEVFNESFGGSEEEMQKRSVVEFYPEIPTDLPILIIQGAADDRVSVGQARKLNHLLSESGHQVEYHEFADGDHILHPHKKEVSEILSHFLKDQK